MGWIKKEEEKSGLETMMKIAPVWANNIHSSDKKDVTVLPADTFQPVNWVGISEIIFRQV